MCVAACLAGEDTQMNASNPHLLRQERDDASWTSTCIMPSCYTLPHHQPADTERNFCLLQATTSSTSNQLTWIDIISIWARVRCELGCCCDLLTYPAGVHCIHARYYWTAPQTESLRDGVNCLPMQEGDEPIAPTSKSFTRWWAHRTNKQAFDSFFSSL